MKLKNKLLSIGAILLLSCQYAPAQAQIVDNSLNPVGVELTLCESIAEFAEDVSNLRQNGAKYSDVIAVAPKPTTQAEKDIKLILDEITYTAWQLNIVESKYGKAYLSEEFGKQVYLGSYNNPTDAFTSYKVAKEAYIRELADKYCDSITKNVYDALIKYKVEITD